MHNVLHMMAFVLPTYNVIKGHKSPAYWHALIRQYHIAGLFPEVQIFPSGEFQLQHKFS